MSASPFPADLPENLLGLARLGSGGGLDMRPVLLRVLTDLFVSRAHHGYDEIRQFETIALGLLDKTDSATKIIVAEKLALCGAAPRSLAERLVSEGGPAAAAMLARSTVLPRAWLLCAAMGEAGDLAEAVAGRPDLDSNLCQILAARPEIEIIRALAANSGAPLDPAGFRALAARAAGDRALAAALCARSASPRDIAPLFLYASHRQRIAILLDARRADLGQPAQAGPSQTEAATAAEIESAAMKGDLTLMAAIVARALGSTLSAAREFAEDTNGEAFALVLCALRTGVDAAARIFMCLDPAIAHNVERVRALVRITADTAPATALRLVQQMIGPGASSQRGAVYVPATDGRAAGAPSRALDNARAAPRQGRGGLLFVRRKA